MTERQTLTLEAQGVIIVYKEHMGSDGSHHITIRGLRKYDQRGRPILHTIRIKPYGHKNGGVFVPVYTTSVPVVPNEPHSARYHRVCAEIRKSLRGRIKISKIISAISTNGREHVGHFDWEYPDRDMVV